ncbi:hypothetical protein BKA82DRAFT_9981 [Pisolithus tinctorius]|nr:hypothetical protein BKA82DRAFT_9981 [Pisolithus tinctorius]
MSTNTAVGLHTKSGLETAAQLTPYKNFIQWSGKVTGPAAEMFLINGNHHVTLIQTLSEKDIVHCQDVIAMIHEGQNERQKGNAAKELDKINEKLSQKAMWLVKFFDLSLFLAIFKPMLSVLDFLASPIQMEDWQTACPQILGCHVPNHGLAEEDCICLLKQIHAKVGGMFKNPSQPPMTTVLETFGVDSLLGKWNTIFSEKFHSTQELLDMSLPLISPTDVTWPVLDNLIVKLQWIQHGFHPVQEPRVHLDTPYPLFTELSMIVIMGSWNTSKITVCKWDNFSNDINYGPALAEVADWLFPLCQYPITVYFIFIKPQLITMLFHHCQVALTQVRVGLAKLFTNDWEKKQKDQIKPLFDAIGDVKWLDTFQTFLKACHVKLDGTKPSLAQPKVNHLTEQEKLLQIPTIWDLHQSVLDLLQGFGPHAKSQAPWLYWDGMESQPTLSPTNPLLALMPKEYTSESLGTAVEQAASAPHITAQNVNAMQKIVKLISGPTLGLCNGESTAKLDPDLKMPLENFLMSLAAVTVKKTMHLQEPTADLTHTAPFAMVQELLGTAGFGSIFQSLQYLNPLKAQEFWQGHMTAELNPYAVQSLHSTSTIAYSEWARLEQQHALDKMARHVRKFAKKKPSCILPQPDDGSDIYMYTKMMDF